MSSVDRTWNSEAPLEQQTMLATWVAEELPEIVRLSKDAETILGKADFWKDPSFDAYVRKDPQRVRAQVCALYEQLRTGQLTYRVEPPGSRLRTRQKIRTPDMVLDPKHQHGCCVDLSLLLATLLYQVQIYPLILVVGKKDGPKNDSSDNRVHPEHAMLGYWLQEFTITGPDHLPVPVLTESQIAAHRSWLAFVECTDFVQPSKEFSLAERDADSWRRSPYELCYAVDIHASRRLGIPSIFSGTNRLMADPQRHLAALYEATAYIDIRGIMTKSTKARRFPIDDIFIPLTASSLGEGDEERPPLSGRASGLVGLEDALRHRVLAIIGDPGSGKTTFLKRVASGLCRAWIDDTTPGTLPWNIPGRPLPVWIRISDLAVHINRCISRHEGPPLPNAVGWLGHFLAAKSREEATGLSESFFAKHFRNGAAIMLLDGLDEAPTRRDRKMLMDLFTSATATFPDCRFVVTGRTAVHSEMSTLSGFHQVFVDALDADAIETFFSRWCEALFPDSPARREQHQQHLVRAVRARHDIGRLARNPVMLTALAVVHWNEKRLPEQRWELYESIITWLSRSREDRPGRLKSEECVTALGHVALEMQCDPNGRQAQVPRRWAAEKVVRHLGGAPDQRTVDRGVQFLEEEEVDSGIIVTRGVGDLAFWHLTFQEFLAAQAIAGLPDVEQQKVLLTDRRLFDPNWREVILLLAGVLLGHGHGRPKVQQLFDVIMDGMTTSSSGRNAWHGVWVRVRHWLLSPGHSANRLTDRAQCVGLLGAVLEDLGPAAFTPDERFDHLQTQVMRIFDRKASESVPIHVAIAAAEALSITGDPRLSREKREDNWVTIPAGSFWMGAQATDPGNKNYDPEAFEDESPAHEVFLDAYQIGRYPVTVGEYEEFKEKGYMDASHWVAGGFGETQEPQDWLNQRTHPSRPTVGVSWNEAAAYAHWRMNQPGWSGCRLPTEAEWERAARGTEGRKFPWGASDPSDKLLNFAGNVRSPTPVGVYPRGATPEGICDMAGNVWEWCWDRFGPYEAGEFQNPCGPDGGTSRVIRGGSWFDPAAGCRSAFRYRLQPEFRHDILGFRVARSPSGE